MYNGNGTNSVSMSNETGIKNYETHTLKANTYKFNGYAFAGWCTIQDTSATTRLLQAAEHLRFMLTGKRIN